MSGEIYPRQAQCQPRPTSAGEVGARQGIQQQRIAQGVRSGSLTARETARLEGKEAGVIPKSARSAANAGTLTRRSGGQVNRQQNRLSGQIYRNKHNAARSRSEGTCSRLNFQYTPQSETRPLRRNFAVRLPGPVPRTCACGKPGPSSFWRRPAGRRPQRSSTRALYRGWSGASSFCSGRLSSALLLRLDLSSRHAPSFLRNLRPERKLGRRLLESNRYKNCRN